MGMDRENADKGTQAGLQDQAAQWFARLLDTQCPPAERAAFERWRSADPKHAAAYRELEVLWKRSAEAVKDPALLAAANRALRREPDTHARRWLFPALAAGVAVLVAAIALPRWMATPADPAGTAYVTTPGQERTEHSRMVHRYCSIRTPKWWCATAPARAAWIFCMAAHSSRYRAIMRGHSWCMPATVR